MAIARNRGKNARNVSQKIWLSSEEAEQVKAAAGDVPVARWLRGLALGQPSKPYKSRQRIPQYAPMILPLTVAVARVGNNLNQIARAVNRNLKARKPLDAVVLANQLAHIRLEMREQLKVVMAGDDRENLQTR